MGKFKETFNAEMAAQRAEKIQRKEARKKAKEAKGPLLPRIMSNARNVGIGLVYSFLYFAVVYCIVLFCTLYLPDLLGVIVSYFEGMNVTILSVECACLFFTAWIFAASFFIVRGITKTYLKGIRRLFHPDGEIRQ